MFLVVAGGTIVINFTTCSGAFSGCGSAAAACGAGAASSVLPSSSVFIFRRYGYLSQFHVLRCLTRADLLCNGFRSVDDVLKRFAVVIVHRSDVFRCHTQSEVPCDPVGSKL